MSDSPFAGTYPKPRSEETKAADGMFGPTTKELTPHLRNGHARTFYKGPRFFVSGPTPLACDACVWGRGEHAEFCDQRIPWEKCDGIDHMFYEPDVIMQDLRPRRLPE